MAKDPRLQYVYTSLLCSFRLSSTCWSTAARRTSSVFWLRFILQVEVVAFSSFQDFRHPRNHTNDPRKHRWLLQPFGENLWGPLWPARLLCQRSHLRKSCVKNLSTSIYGDESIRILVVACSGEERGCWHLSLLCMLQWGFTPFSLRREVFKQRGGEVLWDLYHWWTCWQWNHPTGRSSFFGFADVFPDSLYSLVPKFSPTAPTVQLWHLEHDSHGELALLSGTHDW